MSRIGQIGRHRQKHLLFIIEGRVQQQPADPLRWLQVNPAAFLKIIEGFIHRHGRGSKYGALEVIKKPLLKDPPDIQRGGVKTGVVAVAAVGQLVPIDIGVPIGIDQESQVVEQALRLGRLGVEVLI